MPNVDTVDDLLTSAQTGVETSLRILQDFRRYASDKPLADIQVHRVADILDRIRRHLYYTNANVQVHAKPFEADVAVRASLSALLEVFEVLFNNSIKHSGHSARDLQIEISAEVLQPIENKPDDAPRKCRLVYTDNGCGISGEAHDRIFDPFFTTRQDGNGLGLAIARRILLRQGGRIAEEGAEGQGARFCIDLPVAEPALPTGAVR